MSKQRVVLKVTLCITFATFCGADDLKNFLLNASRYDPMTRPLSPGTNLTDIHTTIAILDMLGMEDNKDVASVLAVLTIRWRDELLTWNPNDYNGTSHLHLSPETIWVPDILTETPQSHGLGSHATVGVTSSGNATLVTRRTLQATCGSQFYTFWSTRHTCRIMFMSGFRSFDAMRLDGASVTSQFGRTHSSWTISPVTFRKAGVSELDFLFLKFSMERKKWPTLWYPVTSSVILTLVTFWLPPTSGRKVTLGCINLFLLAMLLSELDFYFRGQSNVPRVVAFLSHSTALTTASLVVSVLILRIAGGPQGCSVPRPLLNLLQGILGRLLCVSVQSPRRVSDMEHLADDTPPFIKHEARRQQEWFTVAQALDRAFFFMFAISYIVARARS
ncbi:neuronal acetylcholine receptor subunit beta-2-like [Ornithodoros turicata]|uniref:neuronal acetylcholine receptor subunit beta-2-like n=1 Tax=Ornithodoros turicata TaxID=34597 RepID=UPI003139DABD